MEEENFDNRENMARQDFAEQNLDGQVEEAEANPVFRKIIRWLVYAAVFLTPLWFLPFTADVLEFNKQTLLLTVAGIGLALYLVDVIKSGIVRYRPSLFYFPVFGLIAASAISIIFSVNRTTSLFGTGESRSAAFITMASLAVLFFLAVNVIEDKGRALKKIITISLATAFLFGTLQIFGIYPFQIAGFASRAFNSVGSLNSLGILAALALAFFTVNHKSQNHGNPSTRARIGAGHSTEGSGGIEDGNLNQRMDWQNWLVGGARYTGFALALFLIVLINWWPVWTVAFISLVASVAFTSASDILLFKKGRMKLFAMPMAVIVLGIFLMLVNFNWVSLRSKLPVEIAPSHKTSWRIALNSLAARPLGQGAENFIIAYDKFKPASVANTVFYQSRFSDAVSEAASMAVEGGALVLLSFLALLWFYGKELASRIKNGFNGNEEASTAWAASISLLTAFFLYPFNLVTAMLLFLLLAMLILSADDSGRERTINLESNAKYSFVGSLAFITGLVLVLVAGYFTVNNFTANTFLAKAQKTSNHAKAIEYYVKSANSNPNDARTNRLLSQTILAQLADDLKSGPKKDESQENYNARIQNQIASAINIAIRATNINPADSQNWINRGLIYENLLTLVGGADQAAINTYNESLARNPADPNTHLRIGNIYLSMADNLQKALSVGQSKADFATTRKQIDENLTKAEGSFKKAISLYNNFGQALLNLVVVYDRQNRLPDAIKQFEKLRESNPRDPSIAFQIGLLYYRNNQKDNAFNAWQQAVILFPNFSNARWYLSLVYEERGDLGNALKQVQEIEKFNPDNELVKQRLAQLKAGKRTIPPEKVLDKKPLNQ